MSEQNPPLRVVVADDHPVYREGLSMVLGSLTGITVVGEAGSVVEVKNGFARNWLLPKRLAERATADAINRVTLRVGPPPNLGQHNRQVFVDLLGLSEAQVDELTATGALA